MSKNPITGVTVVDWQRDLVRAHSGLGEFVIPRHNPIYDPYFPRLTMEDDEKTPNGYRAAWEDFSLTMNDVNGVPFSYEDVRRAYATRRGYISILDEYWAEPEPTPEPEPEPDPIENEAFWGLI